jgi:hypothetical protein
VAEVRAAYTPSGPGSSSIAIPEPRSVGPQRSPAGDQSHRGQECRRHAEHARQRRSPLVAPTKTIGVMMSVASRAPTYYCLGVIGIAPGYGLALYRPRLWRISLDLTGGRI